MCFIKDFASIAKPLTEILKIGNGEVSGGQSKKIPVSLNEKQRLTFKRLKNILVSNDVMLLYPDYQKPFDLRADASSFALGAVLSQSGKSITLISRPLEITNRISQ